MSKITKFQVLESQSPPKSGDQEKCPPKLLFSDLKFGQNHLFDPFQKHLPPHDIHGWKVMDISFLMGFSKKIYIDPTNFGDSPGHYRTVFCQTFSRILIFNGHISIGYWVLGIGYWVLGNGCVLGNGYVLRIK